MEVRQVKAWQKYVAEFLGTLILVFVGSLAILGSGGDSAARVTIAFGFGVALLAGLYAFGEVSGGHFNPIVSLGMFLDRRLSALDTIWYWIAQFVGADAFGRPISEELEGRAFDIQTITEREVFAELNVVRGKAGRFVLRGVLDEVQRERFALN